MELTNNLNLENQKMHSKVWNKTIEGNFPKSIYINLIIRKIQGQIMWYKPLHQRNWCVKATHPNSQNKETWRNTDKEEEGKYWERPSSPINDFEFRRFDDGLFLTRNVANYLARLFSHWGPVGIAEVRRAVTHMSIVRRIILYSRYKKVSGH